MFDSDRICKLAVNFNSHQMNIRSISSIVLCVVVLLVFGAQTGCQSRGGDGDSSFGLEEKSDSLMLSDLRIDIVEMVETTYSNQGLSVETKAVSISDAEGNPVDFRYFSADRSIYMYFTPLACWECIHTVCKAVLNSDCGEDVVFVIPESLRGAVGRIIAEAEVPADKTFYLHGSLGLPVEQENKLFFFTLSSSPREPGLMAINDVYAPLAYAEAVDAYLSTLAER